MRRRIIAAICSASLISVLASCSAADRITTPAPADTGGDAIPSSTSMSTSSPQGIGLSLNPLAGSLSRTHPGSNLAAAATGVPGAAAVAEGPPMRMVWQDMSTGDRSIWLMDGSAWNGSYAALPRVATEWSIVGSGFFNGDGDADLVWQNVTTGDRSIWFMSGNTWNGNYAALPNVSGVWSIADVGDFNDDGHDDLVWQNKDNGDRSIWFMNGAVWNGAYALLPRVSPTWSIAAVGDFNLDGNLDLVWQNTSTGDRSIWFMDGAVWNGSYALLPNVPPAWRIVAAADFNGDTHLDLVWQNIETGQRSIWLMTGAAWGGSYVALPTVPIQWSIAAVMAAAANPCTLSGVHTIGTTSNGALTTTDCQLSDMSYVDFYSTSVPSANAYLFTQMSAAFDTYLTIISSDALVAENDDVAGGTNSRIKILLPASGSYVLAAGSFVQATGSYTLTSATTNADISQCEQAFIVRGITTAQTVQTTDCTDPSGPYHSDLMLIFLEAGKSFTVTQRSTAVDSYLQLFNSAGSFITFNDDMAAGTLDARITYTPSVSGYYYVDASTAFANETGAYSLEVQTLASLASVAANSGSQPRTGQVISASELSRLSRPGTRVKGSRLNWDGRSPRRHRR